MALAFTNRASQFVTTNATSYVSSTSFTPTAGNLMVLCGYWSSTDTAEAQATSCSGNGVTYSQHATTQFISGVCSGAVWAGIVPASPTLGSVTISGWATSRTGISFQIWEISGFDSSGGTGLSAIADVQVGGPATATSGSVTMTDHSSGGGNLCVGYFDHTAAETISAGASCTLDATGSYATPNRGAGGVHNTSTFANPAASWTTSAAWRGFGIEIKAAVAATVTRQSNWHGPTRPRGYQRPTGPQMGWR